MDDASIVYVVCLACLIAFTALVCVFSLGYYLCQYIIVHECFAHGRFKAQGVSFNCSRHIEYEGDKGVPEAILEHEERQTEKYKDSVEQAYAIAPSALDKLKWIAPNVKRDLLGMRKKLATMGEEAYRLNIVGEELKGHDCLQCFEDAGDRPRIMILCPTCGNKRCPKAENHRYKCTASNEPDQVGQFEDMVDCFTHAVFHTPPNQYSHFEQPKKRETTTGNDFFKP